MIIQQSSHLTQFRKEDLIHYDNNNSSCPLDMTNTDKKFSYTSKLDKILVLYNSKTATESFTDKVSQYIQHHTSTYNQSEHIHKYTFNQSEHIHTSTYNLSEHFTIRFTPFHNKIHSMLKRQCLTTNTSTHSFENYNHQQKLLQRHP